mgnify:CR=1 FL=1
MIGLVGKKVGMTRIFTEDGVSIPVTVIEVEANRVTQVKIWLTMATALFRLPLVLKKLTV